MHSVPQRHSATAPQRHSATATFGLALLIQTSVGAFWVVKLVGAAYLVWLGVRALLSRDLVTLTSHARRPLKSIFLSGLVPRDGLHNPSRGEVRTRVHVDIKRLTHACIP